MIIIEYDPVNGEPVADGKAEKLCQHILQEANELAAFDLNSYRPPVYQFSTENVFYYFRYYIANGDLSHNDILFRYQNQDYQPNQYGNLYPWPKGFLYPTADMMAKMLKAQVERSRAKRSSNANLDL